ncbi:MAG: hypothetical protein JWQ97_293 [Phenylobacterium sp.]|nr:hypothetical protein [Phenylobacterium sp.]
MSQAALTYSTDRAARELAADLLAPFFPGWRGEAPEPALATPINNRPAPAAARVLEFA